MEILHTCSSSILLRQLILFIIMPQKWKTIGSGIVNINFTICTSLPIKIIFSIDMLLLHEQHLTQPIEVMITQHVIHRWCLTFSVYLA